MNRETKPLIIVGASYTDTLKWVKAINREAPQWDIRGVLDDFVCKSSDSWCGIPVLGPIEQALDSRYDSYFFLNNVFSTPQKRKHVFLSAGGARRRWASIIHPSVDVEDTKLGEGVIIAPGVNVGSQVEFKDHSAVRMGSVINHENSLGEFSFIAPGVVLCGRVKIGNEAYIGAGSVIRQDIVIPDGAFVKMGSIVTSQSQVHLFR